MHLLVFASGLVRTALVGGLLRSVMGYHFEFTYCRTHPVVPQWTAKDLVVFYLPDESEWMRA